MMQWLPRGFSLSDDKRIKKVISSSVNWQIYSTNQDTYVLAVTTALYETWLKDYSLPGGIFHEIESNEKYQVFCSKGDYLISSLENGPFPDSFGQVEAFSIAFNTTVKLFPDVDLKDAVYIEEYSLILPGTQSEEASAKDYVYGKWLTGGINISANSFERISKIMSWIPPIVLCKSFRMAGFDVSIPLTNDNNSTELIEVNNDEGITDNPVVLPTIDSSFHLIGRPDLEAFFNDNIIDIVLNQEKYKRMGISFPGATILHGAPGCGKTYAVERLAEYLGWKRFDIDSSTIASPYIHDTSKKISEVFSEAIKAAPSILVIDEMEAFLSNRNMSTASGTHHIEEVAEFLRKIPEAISHGVLVFAMTNMIDTIDPAILRRGRFDHIIEVKMASKEEIAAYLNAKFEELPVAEDASIDYIAESLGGHPFSDVTYILREAGKLAVKSGKEFIDKECFDKALSTLPQKEEKRKIGFA